MNHVVPTNIMLLVWYTLRISHWQCSQTKRSQEEKVRTDMCQISFGKRSNSIQESNDDEGGFVFTKKNAAASTLANVLATGPKDHLNNLHNFCCLICHLNVSMRA